MKKRVNTIIDFVKKDWFRILLAFVLAIAIYESVYNQNQKELNFSNIPVKLDPAPGIYMPDDEELSCIRVSVKVRGSKQAISNLTPADIKGKVVVNSKDKTDDGVFFVRVAPDCFTVAVSGCRVIAVEPKFKSIGALKSEFIKKVKVKPQIEKSALPKDYTLTLTKVIPEEVMIVGPEDIVKDIKDISTEPIQIQSSLTEGFDQEIPLENKFQHVTVEPRVVHIRCEIEKARETRSFKSVPVLIAGRGTDSNVTAELQSPKCVDVEVSGIPSRIAALKDDDISVYVDTNGKDKPGIYELQINCNVKNVSDIKIEHISQGEATVKIESK